MRIFATMLALLLAVPLTTFAKQNQATSFVNDIKTAADGNGEINASIDIECPAKSASGKVIISKASYNFDKSVGAFVFQNTDDTPARMSSLSPEFKDGDFTSNIITGMAFTFKMPNGQFFVDIFKNGKARAGVNKSGQSGINWIQCKIVKPV
ncbi:hypothetical protein [Leclercia adecarboxylata]|uniref:hypothetical protein n=1 Tax=Leclercia adecarboxylata TaxID=83655 RepID=UPI00254F674F|nr:hypothetical protein [Leclercia adecarboxylata]